MIWCSTPSNGFDQRVVVATRRRTIAWSAVALGGPRQPNLGRRGLWAAWRMAPPVDQREYPGATSPRRAADGPAAALIRVTCERRCRAPAGHRDRGSATCPGLVVIDGLLETPPPCPLWWTTMIEHVPTEPVAGVSATVGLVPGDSARDVAHAEKQRHRSQFGRWEIADRDYLYVPVQEGGNRSWRLSGRLRRERLGAGRSTRPRYRPTPRQCQQ